MDSKQIGAIIIAAIGIIVALVILTGGISAPIGEMTQQRYVLNQTLTAAQWQTGKTITLVGRSVSDVIVQNTTTKTLKFAAGNWTIANNVILSDGTLGAKLTVNSDQDDWGSNATAKNITYMYQPLGYVDDAASRSIVDLIVIFAALAIVVFAINQMMNGDLFKLIGVNN